MIKRHVSAVLLDAVFKAQNLFCMNTEARIACAALGEMLRTELQPLPATDFQQLHLQQVVNRCMGEIMDAAGGRLLSVSVTGLMDDCTILQGAISRVTDDPAPPAPGA